MTGWPAPSRCLTLGACSAGSRRLARRRNPSSSSVCRAPGSTLVEQILCSHPEVAAAGELDGFFDRFRIQTQADPTPRLYLEAMDELGTDLVTTITTLYLERIRELRLESMRRGSRTRPS